MKIKICNKVVFGKTLRQPTFEDIPDRSYKFASLKFVRQNCNDYVNYVIDNMPLVGDRRNILVDVKVHNLEKGQIPALPHWHIDCVNRPDNKAREEHNHLFLAGSCMTQFLKKDLELDIEDERPNYDRLLKNFESELEKRYAIPYTVCSYGRALHRARPAVKRETRLLIRVTESDIISPSNKKFYPTCTTEKI